MKNSNKIIYKINLNMTYRLKKKTTNVEIIDRYIDRFACQDVRIRRFI